MLEIKELGYEPDPKQDYIHRTLRELGYDVDWTDSEEDALAKIKARVQHGGA